MHGFPAFLVISEDARQLYKIFRRKDEKQTVEELEAEAKAYKDKLKEENNINAVVVWI